MLDNVLHSLNKFVLYKKEKSKPTVMCVIISFNLAESNLMIVDFL